MKRVLTVRVCSENGCVPADGWSTVQSRVKMKKFLTNALVIVAMVIVIYVLSSNGASWP